MRRAPVLSLALGVALALAPGAHADAVSLRDGRGDVILKKRGTALGKIRRGWLRVTHLSTGAAPQGVVRGCDWRRGRLSRVLECRGRYLSFYIYGGVWRLRLHGRGIDASGVVRGAVSLVGTAGTYELGDERVYAWPSVWRTFRLRS